MVPVEFPQATRVLGRPDSVSEEECGSLSVFAAGAYTVSCWRPAGWRERLALAVGRPLWVWVWAGGRTQPPIGLTTADPFRAERAGGWFGRGLLGRLRSRLSRWR